MPADRVRSPYVRATLARAALVAGVLLFSQPSMVAALPAAPAKVPANVPVSLIDAHRFDVVSDPATAIRPETFDAVSSAAGPRSDAIAWMTPAPVRIVATAAAALPPGAAQPPGRTIPAGWFLLVGVILGAAVAWAVIYLRRADPGTAMAHSESARPPSRRRITALAVRGASRDPGVLAPLEEPPGETPVSDRDERMDMLRVKIEMELESPFAVVITSACVGDGKNVCARGLANSLAAANYRTILVDVDESEPAIDSAVVTTDANASAIESHLVVEGDGVTESSLSHAQFSRTASKGRIKKELAALREHFDAIVINAPPMLSSSAGLLFATESDAVIVALKLGRAVTAADKDLAAIVERQNLPFLGVVTVAPPSRRKKKAALRPKAAPLAIDAKRKRKAIAAPETAPEQETLPLSPPPPRRRLR